MAFTYVSGSGVGALRQGEIIANVWEHQATYPPRPLRAGAAVSITSVWHPLMVVLSPDCDLMWDYEMRFESFLNEEDPRPKIETHPKAISHVLLCDLFSADEFKPRFRGEEWRRVKSNQDSRYHHLRHAVVEEGDGLRLNDLYLDFKKVCALPTGAVYDGVLAGDVERTALIPEHYVHDLIQRFYAFLSRVALPD